MRFFTDAYDLFCITAVTKLIGRLYYFDPSMKDPGALPKQVSNAVTGIALCGALAGQLFFGWLGDKLSRKKVYGINLVTMVGCALASGLSFGSTANGVIATLCFFRFWIGFGIEGDYPRSVFFMSEDSDNKTRVSAVYAMLGIGILVAAAVAMLVSKVFLVAYPADNFEQNNILSTQPQGDFVWRIVLMFGAVPAALTYYWQLKMPETARQTSLVEGDPKKSAADMAKVLEQDISHEDSETKLSVNPNISSYGFFSMEFVQRHGLHLIGIATTRFLSNIAFYSLQFAQKDIYTASGMLPKAATMNAIEEVYMLSRVMFIVALVATVPGQWITVFFIKSGRVHVQIHGFLIISKALGLLGVFLKDIRGQKKCGSNSDREYCHGNIALFVILYGTIMFFINLGPNSTTFIFPAEFFPERFCSTCHGISVAAGKAGAIIGAFVVQSYTRDTDSLQRALVALAVLSLVGFFFTSLVPETESQPFVIPRGDKVSDRDNGVMANADEEPRNSNIDRVSETIIA